jgi:hypothetical protein
LVEQERSELDGSAPASRDGAELEFPDESCDKPRCVRCDEPRTRTSVAVSRPTEGWNTLQETTDAELFGRATLWALGEDKARNEIFNVSNGDVYRWRQLWNELAAFYDLPVAEPLAMSTVSEMSEKGPLWDSIVARYGLHATPYEQIANWSFVDWMLNFGEETILSTIKIRKAGFADCIDTHESFRRQLTKLRELRIIP